MSAPEFTAAFDAMRAQTRANLEGYFVSLQQRFGDPAVYERELHERAAQEARVVHAEKTKTAELLRDAYVARAMKNREAHNARIAKRQGGQSAAARPESAPPRRSSKPPAPAAEPPPQAGPSPA